MFLTFQWRSWSSCAVSFVVVLVSLSPNLCAHCYLLLVETLPCQKSFKVKSRRIMIIHKKLLIHHHSWSEQLLGNFADLELLRSINISATYKKIWRDSEQKEFTTSEWGVSEMGLFFGVSEGLTPLLLEAQQPILSQCLSWHCLLWLFCLRLFCQVGCCFGLPSQPVLGQMSNLSLSHFCPLH